MTNNIPHQSALLPVFKQLPNIEALPELLGQLMANTLYKSNLQQEAYRHIRARHDVEAVQCWLKEYQHSPQTYRHYQKEADRLLLWCLCARHKAFSQLDREDFEAYIHFLSNPQPRDFWCAPRGGRGKKRYSVGWKPFTGPLSQRSKEAAMAALHSLCHYLVTAGYLIFNPFQLMRKARFRSGEEHKLETLERILTPELWDAIKQTILDMPTDTPPARDEKARTRFTFAAFFYLGLRASELAEGHWGKFRLLQDKWWYITHGKGNKLRRIPVQHFLDEVVLFRAHLKLPLLPTPEETGPLIPSWRHGESVSTRHLANIVKQVGIKTAQQFKQEPNKYQRLMKLSPHWLRHQSSSAQAWAGIDKAHVQQNMGHASMQTTEIYFHTLDNRRHEEMNKHILWERG